MACCRNFVSVVNCDYDSPGIYLGSFIQIDTWTNHEELIQAIYIMIPCKHYELSTMLKMRGGRFLPTHPPSFRLSSYPSTQGQRSLPTASLGKHPRPFLPFESPCWLPSKLYENPTLNRTRRLLTVYTNINKKIRIKWSLDKLPYCHSQVHQGELEDGSGAEQGRAASLRSHCGSAFARSGAYPARNIGIVTWMWMPTVQCKII